MTTQTQAQPVDEVLPGCDVTHVVGIQAVIPRDRQGRVRDDLEAQGYRVIVLWADGAHAEVLAVKPKGGA